MRSTDRRFRIRTTRTLAAGVPASLVGSLALVFGATPAQAAEPVSAIDRHPVIRGTGHVAGTTAAHALKAPAKKSKPKTYTVRAGDTVWAIAVRHGLRTADVLALNGLTARSVIFPGQKLRLSGKASAGSAPAKAEASGKASAKTSAKGSHTVRAGDTVWAIAQRHGTSVGAILRANGMSASSIIYPGQKLALPGSGGHTTKPAKSSKSTPAASRASAVSVKKAHTVHAGDTVWSIAQKYGTSVDAVLRTNKLSADSIIYPGQRLAIPGKSAAAAPKKHAGSTTSTKTPIVKLDGEQAKNAKLIIRVGRSLGVSEHGIAIALGTAMQESSLRNLAGGDRDSIGLFQQRPSTGWGTRMQIHNATRSTKVFYGGAHDPNGHRTRGLLDIPGWQKLSYTEAAQAVQISAYPDAYAKWERHARAWLAALG
ncbi:LysM peptidoglycan-binding domain-containing protein [Microbacterium terricola]|uniref:LysM domain-containing protein n=1 Tax=Microbacterium terricola TaxID=344163 RepID=A0ABM8DXM8_9MICO|nr:LysM peptidoglycan-binding domain-containing protein [Microbacterium terricola]UYK38919.1 LysM peptidoglycan-binding domain-containing protein [Microbacterium terricola]BDV30384.1 hypothetical protein Microterr_10440 [Microbacterium terricola]